MPLTFKRLVFAFMFALAWHVPSETQAQTRLQNSLRHFDPETRIVQVCAIEAMRRINADKNPFRPDRALVDAISPPREAGNMIEGSGGAFRSKGKWHQFSYKCHTSPDRMKVTEFEYKIGELIPEEKWSSYGLWH